MKERIVKIARNILFMLSIPAVVGAFAFAKVATKDEVCNEIIISFSNNQLSFVTQKNISELLNQKGVVAHQTKLRSLNISDLEHSIEKNKWVKNSNIYTAADNSIHIKIEQKVPVVRVQPTNDYEEPYYLDAYANRIPISTQYTADLPVATAPEMGFTTPDLTLKSDLVTLGQYIKNDTFWNAAITQINVDEQKSISLIPAFGTQEIILGNIENLDNKMKRLFQFYKQGYQTVNWEKYDEIDLRFERQVVCRNTRGQKIAVDPYDKTTHQSNALLAVQQRPKPTLVSTTKVAGAPLTAAAPATPKKVVLAQPAKPVVTIQKPKDEREKPKMLASKEMPMNSTIVAKAIEKKESPTKEIAKKTPEKKLSKEGAKAKADATEQKAKATEVTESKYFK
nr:cell division protein FtsQ/DivIB [Chitinophagaceae bacterium]